MIYLFVTCKFTIPGSPICSPVIQARLKSSPQGLVSFTSLGMLMARSAGPCAMVDAPKTHLYSVQGLCMVAGHRRHCAPEQALRGEQKMS
ncbi:hypothetical protein M404DRAFT_456922 [Pisolithus tinctorius Marx 270]|uniref:Uncharacterized protein n=1 Tax=Pisolithus tinctorius Marx 270 TaxID=870435 RepID=A0A0C3PY49_PISTI|nr:hypothetical protein M404DRAFT_456922 [Pisolithus tinctorius Marx 270]